LLTVEGRPLHLETEVQREEFEAAIADLLDGTIESLDAALRDAGLSVDQLDKILFVGGSTRIPLVWELVREHTGIEPAVAINPDEAVALGAAVQAAIIAGEPLDAILVDVTSHSLGVEIAEFEQGRDIPDHYSVIIPRNTTVPTSRAQIYSGLYPGQEVVANRRAPRFMQPTPASRLLKSLGPELAWKS
jgi:molecular chaperone DnaK